MTHKQANDELREKICKIFERTVEQYPSGDVLMATGISEAELALVTDLIHSYANEARIDELKRTIAGVLPQTTYPDPGADGPMTVEPDGVTIYSNKRIAELEKTLTREEESA